MANDLKDSFAGILGDGNTVVQDTEVIKPEASNEVTIPETSTSKDEFENPQTGIIIPSSIIIGGVITIFAIRLITKKNKLYNI